MLKLRIFKTFALFSTITFAAACSFQSTDYNAISQLNIKNFNHPTQNVVTGGQPSKKELASLAESGIKHVINLRPRQEQDWNEKEYVESLGMQYHSVPVAGKAGITAENATLLTVTFNQINSEPTFLHCASSNRVGALIALQESAANGADVEAAISKGKRWGLTSLESVVREKLSTP